MYVTISSYRSACSHNLARKVLLSRSVVILIQDIEMGNYQKGEDGIYSEEQSCAGQAELEVDSVGSEEEGQVRWVNVAQDDG